MSGRRAIVGAGLVIAALVAVVLWRSHGRDEHARPDTKAASEPAAPVSAAPPVAAPPTVPTPEGANVGEVPSEAERPQPVPLPESAKPPPLDGKHSEPAPPQKAFSHDDIIAKREADLKLLDDTKARLESDLATARTAHDETAVHDLEIRIARLGDLRKKRSAELDQLRAGGSGQP
jgi:hypothetical protein